MIKNEMINYIKYSDEWEIESYLEISKSLYHLYEYREIIYKFSIVIINYMDKYQIVKNRFDDIKDKEFIIIRYEDLPQLKFKEIFSLLSINKNIIIKYDVATQLLI